jgi:type VI secretion system protein ImpA
MNLIAEPATSLSPCDWQALLEPIPGGDPCGESLRYEGTFDRVRHARQGDDESLAQGVWETTPKKPDWSETAALCTGALANRSKDLQLAAWLLEAWIHLHGFAGAAAGLALIRDLCQRFGDHLHPKSEGGDPEIRYAAISWVNDKLATSLKLVPLTAPVNTSTKVCSWADWEAAQRLVQAGARSREVEETATLARAGFHRSLLETPIPWLAARRDEIQSIIERTQAIEKVIEAETGKDCPSLINLRRVAEAIDTFLDGTLTRREPAVPDPDLVSLAVSVAAEPVSSSEVTSIGTRAQAYRMLSEAAAFLRVTEPHSPVPYLVERAVAWGGMRLVDLLPELIRDRDNLSEIHRLLRIGPAS